MTKAEIITKRFIRCPKCQKHEFQVEHLFAPRLPGSFGPWPCDQDDCDAIIAGRVYSDQTIEITVTAREKSRGLALLRLGHLFLVLEEKYGRIENPDFFYHSHQCPTNLMRRVEEVFDPAHGRDPHGQLRYVAAIDDTQAARDRLDECGTLAEVLTLFKTDGQPAPSEWPQEDTGVLPMIAEWRREAMNKGNA